MDRITLVECSRDVIDLVWPHTSHDRCELVHADAFDYLQHTDDDWDCAWHDIWTETDKGEPHLSVAHQLLMLACVGRVRFQGAWMFPKHHRRKLATLVRERGHKPVAKGVLESLIASRNKPAEIPDSVGVVTPNPADPNWYARYLRSPHWLNLAAECKRRAGYKCARCGSRYRLHVHHLTYERVGAELLSDIECRCRKCHRAGHGLPPDPNARERAVRSLARLRERYDRFLRVYYRPDSEVAVKRKAAFEKRIEAARRALG